MAEVAGGRHAGLAVGLAAISPFTTGEGSAGSLFTRAHGWWGLPALGSLDELPFDRPVDQGWCVAPDTAGALSVRGPDGAYLVHDLRLALPPGWREAAAASGAVLLVVSHVLPAADDMIGALDFETRRGLVCAGPVRFGEPGDAPRAAEEGEPTVRFLLDPVGILLELAHDVSAGLLSLPQAKRRAREVEQRRRVLSEHADVPLPAGEMVRLLFRDEFAEHRGLVALMYGYWTLVAEVADACGAVAAWRDAALRAVETAVPLVAARCERAVFDEADALAARLIDELGDGPIDASHDEPDEGLTDGLNDGLGERPNDGPGDELHDGPSDGLGEGLNHGPGDELNDGPGERPGDGPGGSAELADGLLAAARLRMATRGVEFLAGDHYARGARTVWSARLAADLYRTWATEEEPFQAESHRLVAEAGHLVARALDLAGGTRKARLLACLAQILADERGVDQGAAGAALSAWLDASAADDPEVALFLLRVVDGVPRELVDGLPRAVFGSELADFVAAHGRDVTARVVSQGVNLAREHGDRPLLRTALDWAERLDVRWDAAHRRQLAEARLHVLPEDPTDCPAPGEPLDAAVPSSWSQARRSAALLHRAAHARDLGRPALGLALLKQAGGLGSEAERLLTADLYHQAALAGQPVDGPVPFPWGYHSYAALGYASLGFEELARACLVPFVAEMGNLRGEELRAALFAVIVDVPNFDTGRVPELAGVLRDLVHAAVWRLTAESETLPLGLMLGLHQAGKGPEVGAWWRIEGPLAVPAGIQHLLGRLRDLERPDAAAPAGTPDAAASADVPPADLPGGASPLLNVLDADRRPGGGDARQLARNLRWHVSSLIDDELGRRSAPLVDDQRLWARTHELLDDRTVLLSWFLPAAVRGAAVLLAVTRQGRDLVVHLGDGADENDDRHPVADLVEAIRTEVERDPLFGDVTPEGGGLLRQPGGLPLGGGALWEGWRARGKDRILAWPHGALHYLPLPLCRIGDRLIADDWTVTTIAGLEALAPAAGPERPRRTAVLAAAEGGVPYGLPAEPALEEHARRVADAVGADAVTGPAATRARLLAELATADVVHIAAHGTLDQDAPWLHCLYLTADRDDDGRVFAHDFLEIDLRGVRLVTLAACESALGRFDRADNVRGIPSALITAGARAVVGCLWPVRPEAATYFHHHMHRRIAHGTDPERAFRDAQLATRARHSHYRDWGAFSYLHGRSQGAVA
ncbi:CHAT domain-containing protein [Streptomyces sp. DSM 44915]|uniref:CHAT domain-containing protein n=1 Tax=Streptomyces chisholmiae TaxID=3075540 RepID=A0ABU2JNS7_9ACTN|nr:CHAT domain-containing protein [Streptomyces sp. DSM 44915]MDT0266641.1 CHAT domain-containing protein [Streptomyces sp. DSM 44915]